MPSLNVRKSGSLRKMVCSVAATRVPFTEYELAPEFSSIACEAKKLLNEASND
jgi:hypothetical protein